MCSLRIASLLPSATEIVHALGLGEMQVGRSHECDFPAAAELLPVCSRPSFPISGSSQDIDTAVKDRVANAVSLYEIDTERLAALQPTHILTQSQCAVCAVSLDLVEKTLQCKLGSEARLISLEPNSLEDIWRDILYLAESLQMKETGHRLIDNLKSRIFEIAERSATSKTTPRVACIEWLQPLMAAGNWIPELVEYAGGSSLFGRPGEHSPWMSWDELLASSPDVIIAMPCGFDLQRTREEIHWLTEHPAWHDLPAVRNRQVYLCDGHQFMNRPGPRVVESVQILAEILHPGLFTPALEHTGWERL